MRDTARRGSKLREHILWVAKDVFLELGFERASMDVVAGRAETSKRSLYAHFQNKEKLFHAVFELMCGLFLGRLKPPGELAQEPQDALVLFCGRYLEHLLIGGCVRLCRLSMAEATRFPQTATLSFDSLFSAPQHRLSTYLAMTFELPAEASFEAAQLLQAQILHPRFHRALLGVDQLRETFNYETLAPDFDLEPIRRAVADSIRRLADGGTIVPHI